MIFRRLSGWWIRRSLRRWSGGLRIFIWRRSTTRLLVKYRIDGVLQQAMAPIAREHHQTILSRIKVMSELDIAERRVPQDGRFRVRYKGRLIDFRVWIMPTVHGENAVLRVLDKESMSEKFKKLEPGCGGVCGEGSGAVSAVHQGAVRDGAGDGADGFG